MIAGEKNSRADSPFSEMTKTPLDIVQTLSNASVWFTNSLQKQKCPVKKCFTF